MNTLGYLLLTTIKNRILTLRKKPALLVLYSIIIISIVGMFIAYSVMPVSEMRSSDSPADIRILYGIIAAVGALFLFSFVFTGLSTGSTLFNMADVGLLFVSPISSKKILIYGLIKQAGTTFISAVFILFQVGTLKQNFNIEINAIFSIFIIYAILIFFCQLMSIAVYIYTNGNSKRKDLIKYGIYVFAILIIGFVWFYHMQHGGSIMENVLEVISLRSFQFIPVVGWAIMFFSATIEGSLLYLVISLLLFLISSIGVIILFTSGDADYYEDVLHSTEFNFNRLQDAKNGKTVYKNTRKVKVKEEEIGMHRGVGAMAIYHRHVLEKKRESRFLYIDRYTVFAAIGSGLLCYIMKNEESVYFVLGILVYLQFFLTLFGKLAMELSKPYIYMIPAKSIKKVIAASMTSLIKPCYDAVIIFAVVCIVSKTSPLLNAFLALAYASSGAIFVSYKLLTQRIFGSMPNKIAQAMLGMILFFIVILPGVVASVAAILYFLPKNLVFLGTLPFSFSCVVICIFVFVLCGDLIDKSEYTGK